MTLREPFCLGQRVLVVGSAPGLALPPVTAYDVALGANGGAAILREAGRRVEALITTTYLFREDASSSELATRARLRGLEVPIVWFDEKGGEAPSLSVLEQDHGILALGRVRVNPEQREAVVKRAIDENPWVSTGVWAALLASVSGARSITLVGVNPGSRGGHHGSADDGTTRMHREEDARALDLLSARASLLVLEEAA